VQENQTRRQANRMIAIEKEMKKILKTNQSNAGSIANIQAMLQIFLEREGGPAIKDVPSTAHTKGVPSSNFRKCSELEEEVKEQVQGCGGEVSTLKSRSPF